MFNRLFKSTPEPKDGLLQAQREALVDLLNYCMFADKLVTISESRFVAAKVEELNRDPKMPFDYYQNKSIGAARAALDKPEAKKIFFGSVHQRLATPEVRNRAFTLCQKLFLADGIKRDSESAVQVEIRQTLHIAQ